MNIRRWVAFGLVCALTACGGGGGANSGNATTPGPQLGAFTMGPAYAYTGNHPGSVALSGAVVVSAIAANGMQVSLVNLAGNTVAQGVGVVTGPTGLGTLGISTSLDISSLPAGDYAVRVQATSANGGTSNVVSQPFQLVAYPWRSLTSMPSTLSEFAAAAVGSKAYVLTGLSTINGVGTATDAVQVYDTVTGNWTTGPQAPRARAGATASVVGTRIYLMGGYNGTNPSGVSQVDILDTQTGLWSSGPDAPTARFYSCAAAIGSQIYLVDGTQTAAEVPATPALERLDTTTGTWAALAPASFPISNPACTTLNGKMYVTGGESKAGDFSELIASQWYDPAINLWATTNFFAYNRSRHGSVAIGGRVFLLGGRSDAGGLEAPTDQTEVFDPTTNSWVRRAAMPAPARDVRAVVAADGLVYVFAPTASYVYDAASEP